MKKKSKLFLRCKEIMHAALIDQYWVLRKFAFLTVK